VRCQLNARILFGEQQLKLSYPTYPPSIRGELFYTDSAKDAAQIKNMIDVADRVFSSCAGRARGEKKIRAAPDALLALKPLNPCPVCGAETALAEIEPHPLHVNFEIHGYLCDRCGPIKSLVVHRWAGLVQ
jgi:hypothetical protein